MNKAVQETFGMIKPEGLRYAQNIETMITEEGLTIEEQKQVTLTTEEFTLIYGHAQTQIPNIYYKLETYMTTHPTIVMRITGNDAVERLLRLRGASNPVDAAPDSIRGMYAKGQDYKELYAKGEFSKNVFHAADNEEAATVLEQFFGGKP